MSGLQKILEFLVGLFALGYYICELSETSLLLASGSV